MSVLGFWILCGIATFVALVACLWPLLRRPQPYMSGADAGGPELAGADLTAGGAAPVRRLDYDLAVYRDQLAEVARDEARGLIGAEDARSARIEIERRMLAAADRDQEARAAASGAQGEGAASRDAGIGRLVAAVLLLLAIPVGSMLAYLSAGNPGMPDQPFASRAAEREALAGMADKSPEELVTQLAAALQDRPNDARGWALLARSLSALGRFSEAIPAWQRLVALEPASAGLRIALAQTLMAAAGGVLTPEARAAFAAAQALDPEDPEVRFFQGLVLARDSKPTEALAIWRPLAASLPAETPWLAILEEQIAAAAEAVGEAPGPTRVAPLSPGPAASGQRGPSPEDMAAAAAMPKADQDAMIRSMVERLAERLKTQPDDLDGWRRLGQVRGVLGEHAASAEAYGRAAALAPAATEVQIEHIRALIAAGGGADKPLSPAAVAGLQRLIAIAPEHEEALWYLGVAALQSGDITAARGHWQRLLSRLPADSPQRERLKARLEALPQG